MNDSILTSEEAIEILEKEFEILTDYGNVTKQSEAYRLAIDGITKLDKIKNILEQWNADDDHYCEDYLIKIEEILEHE